VFDARIARDRGERRTNEPSGMSDGTAKVRDGNADDVDASRRREQQVSNSFDLLAKTLSVASEARSAGERQRAKVALTGILKQHVAELDEMRALCERVRERVSSDGSDAMDAS
jgi:hypothetical protein